MRISIVGEAVIGATIHDPKSAANGASGGNAGAFAFRNIVPLATGILRQACGWPLDPPVPLSIRPRYATRLLEFFRASLPERYSAARNAQAAPERLLSVTGSERLSRRERQLQVYGSEQAYAASRSGWGERAQAGVRFGILGPAKPIAEVQPGFAPHLSHAVFTPDWINTAAPKLWVQRIAEDAVRNGDKILLKRVEAIRTGADRAQLEIDNGQMIFDRVVLAAGAHSNRLLRALHLSIPLETERGYSNTPSECNFDLRAHVTFTDHGLVVTRIGDALRGGGLEPSPNMKRAEILLAKAKHFLPDLDTSGGTQWTEFRPSMPGILPVIRSTPGHPSASLAFGYGHLGLTQGAGTTELLVDFVAGRMPPVDMTLSRPDRFLLGAAAMKSHAVSGNDADYGIGFTRATRTHRKRTI